MIDTEGALMILAKCARFSYAFDLVPVGSDPWPEATDEDHLDRFQAFLKGVGRPAKKPLDG